MASKFANFADQLALKTSHAVQSPGDRTRKVLKDSIVSNVADTKMTNPLNYKLPEIYDGGGDLSKQWFVYYSFRDPRTNKFKRFKVFMDINSFKLKGDRMDRAKLIRQSIKELLEEGFDPFKEHRSGGRFTFCNCIDIFLENMKPHLREKSYARYYYEFRTMKSWFEENGMEDLHISDVTKKHIFEFLEFAKKRKNWTSGKTYNTHKANISRLFNYFINNYDDVVDKNPVSKIESKPFSIKGNQPYNETEFTAIKETILATDPGLWRICQFVYYAAVRNEREGLNLKVGDIDWAQKRLVIRPELSKARKLQYIPIYPEFMEVLTEMDLEKYPPDFFIFGRGDKPGPVQVDTAYQYVRFRKAREAAGVSRHHGMYSFKHTRACHMVDDGATLLEIKELFRHESLLITMEYLKSVGRIVDQRALTRSRRI